MRVVDIIAKKRDGGALSPEEISFVIQGYTADEIPDYQMAALLMAIYLRGMTPAETLVLTDRMLHSGTVVDFSSLGKTRVDKHSTGGVGDKASLVIAPVVASAGVLVPMISGRALGHSGGTLDKLESIPGFRTDLSLSQFRTTLETVGAALIGQTAEVAPADKKLYALRDVTATVPCKPLMAASIMSKKMAEGITGLVLDIKSGSGAFLKTDDDARQLATLMLEIGRNLGTECTALITDMSQPLGNAIGNSLEVIESLETLKGRGPEDLNTLCRELSAEMILLGRAASTIDEARGVYDDRISSGKALEKMAEMISAQSGNPAVVDDYTLFPSAKDERSIRSNSSGYLAAIDTEAVGRASMELGAGRTRLDATIDPGVGIRMQVRIGDRVEAGSVLAVLLYNDDALADQATDTIGRAFEITGEPAKAPSLIRQVIR